MPARLSARIQNSSDPFHSASVEHGPSQQLYERPSHPYSQMLLIAGGLWLVVSGIVAAFVGGYIASRVSGRPSKTMGSYHGLTSWAVTTLIVLYLLTTSSARWWVAPSAV